MKMQNIPVPKTELSERLKKMFDETEKVEIPNFDYGEMELRVLANMSDEELQRFIKGPP